MDYYDDSQLAQLDDDFLPTAAEPYRPGPLSMIVIILLILALLTTLIWPILVYGPPQFSSPTPTPIQLQDLQAT